MNIVDFVMNGKKLFEWSIDDKMAYLEPAFNEYGYSDRQRELFRQHIMEVWPDGSLSISQDVVVEPIYFDLHDEMGNRVKGFVPEWTTEQEWWGDNDNPSLLQG